MRKLKARTHSAETAKAAGREARLSGKSLDANPWKWGGHKYQGERSWWEAGWMQANAESASPADMLDGGG